MSPHKHKPNSPIDFEDVLISHINGRSLDQPITARVVLRFSPNIRTAMESKSVAIEILDHLEGMPITVTVKDKCDVQVFYSGSWFPRSNNSTLEGSLVLQHSPVTVIQRDCMIDSIDFSVLNFPKFYGGEDKWVDNELLGTTKLTSENMQVLLTQEPSLSKNEQCLRETNGYCVTHTGIINYSDGSKISVKEAEHILLGLRTFLSFARGAACGLTHVKASCANGTQTFFEWGTRHTDSWNQESDTWFRSVVEGGESLAQAFAGFWSLYKRHCWQHVLRTIDYYINSKAGPFHVGIILIQAALELLCCSINGSKEERPMGEFLSKSIRKLGLCTSIPPSCNNLQKFFQDCSGVKNDGPKAIASLRNDLVHTTQNHQDNAVVQMEALQLGLWYIELILLKQFNYRGSYRNRLTNTFELVPWVKNEHETK